MKAQAIRTACAFFIVFVLAATPRPPAYHVQLECGSSPCTFPIPAVMERYARLQTYVTTVRLSIAPSPPVMPRITWHASNPAQITIRNDNPFVGSLHFPGDTAPEPTPNPLVAILVPGRFEGNRVVGEPGPSTVSVEVGPPVNVRLTFPVFSYQTVELGCYFASSNGIAFDHGHAINALTPQESDLYVTGASGAHDFNSCGPKFAGDAFTFRAPYGATIVNAPFNTVQASAWRDDFHDMPLPSRPSGVLLAKTRHGQIVKLELNPEQEAIQGSYLVADGTTFADNAAIGTTLVQQSLRGSSSSSPHPTASIIYRDPPAATYGTLHTVLATTPWQQKLPFYQSYAVIGVEVSPQPYMPPATSFSIDGSTATIDNGSGLLRGVRAGAATLRAHVGSPVSRTISIPVVTYDPLIVSCGSGVRFTANGTYEAADVATSDLYISSEAGTFACQGEPQVWVPGGGVMLSNGNDPWRQIANGAERGAQFPEVTGAQWRDAMRSLDIDDYRRLTAPCSTPVSTSVARIDYGCTAMSAHVLLFRTRDGRYVKWLLTNGNGLNLLAGPYHVL